MKSPYLFFGIHMVIASVLGWTGIVTVLVMDMESLTNILLCIAVSFVVAAPIAMVVQKAMTKT